MAFTNFSKSAGHTQLAKEIIDELEDLAQRHGIRFSSEGGQLGADNLMIKLRVRTADQSSLESAAKQRFAMDARYVGLEPDDYGAIFSTFNGTYKLTGLKPSAPKYPILGVCQRSGKTFKLPRSVIQNIIAARKPQASQQPQSSSSPASSQHDDRYADVAQF